MNNLHDEVLRENRGRADWIASLPGFWYAVWEIQDEFGIARYREKPLEEALDPRAIYYTRLTECLRQLSDDSEPAPLPHPSDSATSGDVTADDLKSLFVKALYWAAVFIVRRYNLAESDTTFVAGCIHGGLESYIARVYPVEAPVHVARMDPAWLDSSPRHEIKCVKWLLTFQPGRIYLDVTDVADIRKAVEEVIPAVEELRQKTGIDLSRQLRQGPGGPPKRVIAAYADLLYNHGPIINGRTMTWENVAEAVNKRFNTTYDRMSIGELVRRHRPMDGRSKSKNRS